MPLPIFWPKMQMETLQEGQVYLSRLFRSLNHLAA